MDILFVSDYVCPYCLVAKEALKAALKETALDAAVTWQPFELTPEPGERLDTYHDETRRARYQILAEPCRQLGLDMKLPPKVVPRPYTRLAFEGWYYACDKGRGEQFNDLVYRAYFIEEQDIGEISVLSALAQRAGLDAGEFTAALESGAYTRREQEAVRYARDALKVQGVPSIYIDGEKISLRAFTREELSAVLLEKGGRAKGPGVMCSGDTCTIG